VPEPKVIQAINLQRESLHAHEAAVMRDMAQRWLGVEDALKADMLDLSLYLDELRAKGETITAARLMQMDRYQTMIADARREHERYARWVADQTLSDQRMLVAQGVTDAQVLIEAAALDAKIAAITFNRINVSAVEFMAGFASDGTPLYDLLKASYPETVARLTDNLIQGLASGKGPRWTATQMATDMAGNLDRALLIARTEQIRALRAGNLEQMRGSNVVDGYIRRAQRSANVCAACLALDGQEYDVKVDVSSHPACACYMQPKLKYGKTPSFPTGEEWFNKQPKATQLQILGKGRYKLYQDGNLDFSKLAQIKHDDTWGATIQQRPLKELAQ
jgi:hypothetical protein